MSDSVRPPRWQPTRLLHPWDFPGKSTGVGCHHLSFWSYIFRSLIHFEFIFVYGVRKCSSFILLQVVDQFSQHHLLKRLSLIHCVFLPPLSKIRCPYAWIYLWAFCFVLLICISVFVPIPYCLDDCGFVVEPEVR